MILQKALSESLAFVLLMTSYLIFNDDLLVLSFSNFNNSIINDQFAFCTRILICIFSAFYFLIVASCLKEQKIISFEYLLIILLAVLGLLLMCNSNDFLITYLAIELATLAFYILASFQKTSNCSVDAAVKYFIIGAVSSAFFLLGSSFIYGFTGSINFSEFFVLFGNKFDWTYDNYGELGHEDSIFFIGANLDRAYGLKPNQESCFKILLYFECGSISRWLNGNIITTVDSRNNFWEWFIRDVDYPKELICFSETSASNLIEFGKCE